MELSTKVRQHFPTKDFHLLDEFSDRRVIGEDSKVQRVGTAVKHLASQPLGNLLRLAMGDDVVVTGFEEARI